MFPETAYATKQSVAPSAVQALANVLAIKTQLVDVGCIKVGRENTFYLEYNQFEQRDGVQYGR